MVILMEAKRKLIKIDKPITAENIKNNILGKEDASPKHMLMQIFKHHNDQIGALVDREYSPYDKKIWHFIANSFKILQKYEDHP